LLNKNLRNVADEPPDIRESAAAALLVLGLLAFEEYGRCRGQDVTVLGALHKEAVAAWADTWGCDHNRLEIAISNLRATFSPSTENVGAENPSAKFWPVNSALLLH
jgi:hypothetical protein